MAKSPSSKRWLREHTTDAWVRKAALEGYRSRAAYKLLEIDARDRLLRPGARVLDLGAAPGGWSQVAAAKVGRGGRVVACDLLPMEPLAGVVFVPGDFAEQAVLDACLQELAGPADLVLSDMAPNLSGVKAVDQARVMGLAELALDAAGRILRPGGSLLVKLFQGEGTDAFQRELRSRFDRMVVRKPEASRSRSAELYVLATGYGI